MERLKSNQKRHMENMRIFNGRHGEGWLENGQPRQRRSPETVLFRRQMRRVTQDGKR